jgi:hypothetical protein
LPPDGVGKSGRLMRHRTGQAELIGHRTAMCTEGSFSVVPMRATVLACFDLQWPNLISAVA